MGSKRLAIIADDLTGAMDSSGHLANQGLSTVVLLDAGYSTEADIVAVTTDSRAEDPKTACKRVKQAVERLTGRIIYKKIDSTLRGNIGVELEAILENQGYHKAIVAPAFPAMRRTTEAGVLLIEGIPVSKTQFDHDPVLPVRESHIPTLLERSTKYRVGCVGLEDIEAGPESLYHHVTGMPQRIIVCDVKLQSHLTMITQAAILADKSWLLCGSSGLARETHLLLDKCLPPGETAPANAREGAVLAIVGSRNPVSAEQLKFANETLGLFILEVDVEQLFREDTLKQETSRILDAARRILKAEKQLALSIVNTTYKPELKHSLPVFLADITVKILEAQEIAGLFLSGGDIAVEVCRRLGISAISVYGEIEPGIPAGITLGDQIDKIRVVTKAGGFGEEGTLVKSLEYLNKGELS
jgi:uncharacterized protein YgbK (DUF1537 family)